MNIYEPQIIWELTRAAVSIAAWWVLFYRLHRPQALWRRIVLLTAMPAAYTVWRLLPRIVLLKSTSWVAIVILLALLRGDLRRSLFSAFFYIGMEMSIDGARSAMIAVLFGGFFPLYSPGYYAQYNLQYLVVLGAVLYYQAVIKRYSGKPTFSGWLLTILPPFGLWAALTYYAIVAEPLLEEQGINIYGPGFCFGVFCIMCNMAVFYIYTRLLTTSLSQALAIEISGAEPVWTAERGLSAAFREKYSLTDRGKDVTDALMRGKSNTGIADTLYVSRKTVEAALSEIYRKTGATNRFALYSLI